MKVYIASLSDYNNGRLEGKWFDLSDYLNASDLMDDINDMLKDLTKKYKKIDGEVREEWAVHDYEGIPPTLASEYMGEADFQKLMDIREIAEENNIPVEVLVERAGDTGSDDYQALADSLVMVVDGSDETDIVYELEDQLGDFGNDFWKDYIFIDDVTERVMYGEDVDRFREDIIYENPDMDEDEAERQAEEMADEEADRRRDLSTYLEDMGYGDEIPHFVTKDYNDAWKYALSYDYDVIHHDDQMYVFTNNYSVGGTILSGLVGAYIGYKIGRAKPQKKGFETEKKIGRKIKGAFSKKKYDEGGGVEGKMSYERFVETLRDNDKIDGYTGRTTKGMEMYYLPSGHSFLGKKFAHKNKRKAYNEYLQLGKKIGYSEGGKIVVYAENEEGYYRKISEHDTMRGAKTKMNNIWQTNEYYGVGAVPIDVWEKRYAPYQFKEGGGIGFKGLSDKVAKRYAGKKVAPKYQGEYGKRYSKSEAKEVGDKVAGKVYWQQQGRKMAMGGEISDDVKVFSVEKMRNDPTLKRKMAMGFYIPIFKVGEKTAFGFIETPKSVIEEGKAMSNVKAVKYKNGKIKLVFGQKHYSRGGNVNTGRSWHLDRARHNKAESYEKPLNNRKRKYEDGGQIGQEIVFDDNGEENTGVIKDIHEITGDYIVSSDDGRTILAQRDRDVISLGKMREKAPRKRFGFFAEGGGVDSIKEGDEVIWKGNKYRLTKIEKSTKGGFYDKKYYLSSNEVGISDAILDSLKDVKKHKYAKGGGVSGLDDLIRG